MKRQPIICGIILIFLLSSIIPFVSSYEVSTNNIIYVDDRGEYYTKIHYKTENGSLSGFVNDSFFNPIEGALVSIKCGGLHMQNTSDSNGFYYIDNVPIVDCYWNVSASKKWYEIFWVEMSIDINSTYDFVLTPLGKTLYVGGSGAGNYTTIQSAIDDAIDGDTVFVYSGIYYEQIVIDKSIILQGENRSTTVIDGSKERTVIFIEEGFVNLSGFTIQKSGGYYTSGIMVNSSFNYISNNNITSNWYNIRLNIFSSNNILTNNSFLRGTMGISLESYCDNNSICNNTFIDVRDGISLDGSSNNTIIENYFSENRFPIYLTPSEEYHPSDNNQIIRNTITHNGNGIIITFSNNNLVDNNTLQNNYLYGIRIDLWANSNTILNNDIYNSYRGIEIYHFSNDTYISHNNILNSETQGIYIENSYNNNIENNNISNNKISGITIHLSANNSIEKNNISNNSEYGVALAYSSNNNMVNENIINNNMDVGIICFNAYNNTATRNIISDNQEYGIYAEYLSNNNTFSENSITNNRNGTYFHNSSDNIINYNNFIKNKRNANFKDCRNIWNNNYWNRPRFLPKLIFGKIDSKLRIEVDWHPRLLPNNIGGG